MSAELTPEQIREAMKRLAAGYAAQKALMATRARASACRSGRWRVAAPRHRLRPWAW